MLWCVYPIAWFELPTESQSLVRKLCAKERNCHKTQSFATKFGVRWWADPTECVHGKDSNRSVAIVLGQFASVRLFGAIGQNVIRSSCDSFWKRLQLLDDPKTYTCWTNNTLLSTICIKKTSKILIIRKQEYIEIKTELSYLVTVTQ